MSTAFLLEPFFEINKDWLYTRYAIHDTQQDKTTAEGETAEPSLEMALLGEIYSGEGI